MVAKSSALKNAGRKGRAGQGSLRAVAASQPGNGASGESGTKEKSAAELDRLIHERLRLGIVSALAVNQSLTFNELKETLKTSDGNLSVHARKLEDAAYISCEKSFDGRMPKTVYRLTAAGRRALERYLNHMESIIRMTRER